MAVGNIAVEHPQRVPTLSERCVRERQRAIEPGVGRPASSGLFENGASACVIARAYQRVAEPRINLRQIAAVDERRLPCTRRLGVVTGGGHRRSEIGQGRCAVDVRPDGAFEAGLRARIIRLP